MAAGGGSIINVSSTGAVRPTSDIVPYAAAKAGVNAMTVGLAHAFGPEVRVNAIMPGPFLTTIARAWDMDLFAERARTFPLRRAGAAEEIVGAALYLASDASSYTTGAVLTVDGGAQWSMPGTGEPRSRDSSLEVRSSTHVRIPGAHELNQPMWLQAVHRLERTIGEPVEAAVRTDAYFDVVTVADRARRKAIGGRRGRLAPRGCTCSTCRRALTSASVREQLPAMERRLDSSARTSRSSTGRRRVE